MFTEAGAGGVVSNGLAANEGEAARRMALKAQNKRRCFFIDDGKFFTDIGISGSLASLSSGICSLFDRPGAHSLLYWTKPSDCSASCLWSGPRPEAFESRLEESLVIRVSALENLSATSERVSTREAVSFVVEPEER